MFDFDIFADARVTGDVHASTGAALVAAPAVFYTPRNGGHWVVRGVEAAGDLLKDSDHFSSREMHIPRLEDHPVFIPLSLDPPQCIPFRMALMPIFSAKNVRALEPVMRGWARKIVEAATLGEECDFARDVAPLYPINIFMELMGMPPDRLREFRTLAGAYFGARDDLEVQRLAGEITGVMGALIAERRASPGHDVISSLLNANVEGRKVSADEVLAMCFLLFLAGMDTVANISTFAFRHLAADRAMQERLKADKDLIPRFVEEALRKFPIVNPSRLVIRDCERFGAPMRTGEMVLCLLTDPHFDERLNPHPERFDIDRERAHHLSFGSGAHLCIGHILARAELRILIEEWLDRVPRFTAELDQRPDFRIGVVSAIESLILRWAPAQPAA